MLEIISHRGLWKAPAEKNTLLALQRAFDVGFGIETDIRDCCGEMVISHDMPTTPAVSLQELLVMPGALQHTLALNIKADGLAASLQQALAHVSPQRWFVFDMSVPDMKDYILRGMPVYARLSDVEQRMAWMEQCAGVWLDAFSSVWYSVEDISSILALGKRVCVVSEELHGRNPEQQWQMLRTFRMCAEVMLCTDKPEQARVYFGVTHD